jgi:hypothetical protein
VILLYIDLDGTLIDSRSLGHLLPKITAGGPYPRFPDFKPWLDAINATALPVVDGARGQLAALLQVHRPLPVVVTARSEHVRRVTEEWIHRHFPELDSADKLFRPLDDNDAAVTSKARRIRDHRALFPHNDAYILDDDPGMSTACDNPGDRFILAAGARVDATFADELIGRKP